MAPSSINRWVIAIDGESRRSSVRALKVRPQTARVLPAIVPPQARRTLATMRSRCSSLTVTTPRNRPKS